MSISCTGISTAGEVAAKVPSLYGLHNCLKIISHYKKTDYNINVLQQIACLVVDPITVGNFAFLFNCTPVGWNFRLYDGSDLTTYLLMRWLGPVALAVCRAHPGLPVVAQVLSFIYC